VDAEGSFFTALLKSTNAQALRHIDREHLTEHYRGVYDWVLEFFRANNGLPRWETVDNQFPRLLTPEAPEDPGFYAQAIRDNAMRLAMEDGFQEHVVTPLSEGRARPALEGAQKVITDLKRTFRDDDERAVLDIRANVEARMADYRLRKLSQGILGYPSPWVALTQATGGLQPADVACILARPSIGKTWGMVLWACFLWQRRFRILFASQETPPQTRKSRDYRHRVIAGVCLHCYQRDQDPNAECTASRIDRQRLTVRFDAIGARLSAWRLWKGCLTPQEERKLERYYAACADPAKWGDLKIVAPPYVRNIVDLELEIQQFQPDIVFWDSAYMAIPPGSARDLSSRAGQFVHDTKRLAERMSIPIVVSWHFNREVDEKATDASMGDAILTDEVARVWDTEVGLFRPQDLLDAGEAAWRTLKTRDGVQMPLLKTYFKMKDEIDFREIGTAA
jgi:hypothetical protein